MNTKILSVSSRVPHESYYRLDVFIKSLHRFGVAPIILGLNEPWRGLMTKANLYRAWLRSQPKSADSIIVCDAWDIVFAKHPDTISAQAKSSFGDALVFNGERACWPLADLADHFPDTGSPWRYLNGGVICGPQDMVLHLFENMKLDEIGLDEVRPDGSRYEPNDQSAFLRAYVEQPVRMMVDTFCNMFQCLSGCDPSYFDFGGDEIKNCITGSHPGIFHFNGGSKNDLMPLILKYLNLE